MNLQREIFLRVEQFRQDGKTRRIRDFAEHRLAMFRPKLMQGLPAKRTFMDDALRFGAIDDLP